ncbi:hypothetical protein TNIN_241611 [Trichonephila inaurata madagascariensis]|uniref:Uncharacterized protein n=1 Tax=Trichonephila inaurata madagascariensis TaxID=2747483 RepID=A0A8X6YBI8_9ARAC|nr:hypothetical protein TNIN_241611 [Trichonephila inaurata madagascariensis]
MGVEKNRIDGCDPKRESTPAGDNNFTDRWSLKTGPRLNIHSLSPKQLPEPYLLRCRWKRSGRKSSVLGRSNEVLSFAILHLIRLFLITNTRVALTG